MKSFFKDKFEYNYKCNDRIVELANANLEVFDGRVSELISHTLNAQHFWNLRILGKRPDISVWDEHKIEDLKSFNNSLHAQTMNIIDVFDLDSIIKYETTTGESHSGIIEDVLFHVVNHGTYHRGQLISDLKSKGVSPITTDFIFFKR